MIAPVDASLHLTKCSSAAECVVEAHARGGSQTPPDLSENLGKNPGGIAKSGALEAGSGELSGGEPENREPEGGAPVPPALRVVIRAWPSLPEAIRRAVLALVQAGDQPEA